MKTIIKTENLTFGYGNNIRILDNFDMSIPAGGLIGILGPNGAGKSTLFRLLSGFLKPLSGAVYIDNKNIAELTNKKRAELIAVVSQNTASPMPYNVRQIVEMGRAVKVSRFLPLSAEDINAVENAMDEMDVMQFADRQFNELSGGEQQRVKLAAALAQEPKILLLDEPTSQLDMGHSVNLMRLITKLNQIKKITIAIVSHDIQLMSSFLERLIILKDGNIVTDGAPEKILNSEIIRDVYNCQAEIYKDNQNRIHLFPN